MDRRFGIFGWKLAFGSFWPWSLDMAYSKSMTLISSVLTRSSSVTSWPSALSSPKSKFCRGVKSEDSSSIPSDCVELSGWSCQDGHAGTGFSTMLFLQYAISDWRSRLFALRKLKSDIILFSASALRERRLRWPSVGDFVSWRQVRDVRSWSAGPASI